MKQFLKRHKYPLILFILFLMIAIFSWSRITNYQLLITNQIQNPNEQTTITTSLNYSLTTTPTNSKYQIADDKKTTTTSTTPLQVNLRHELRSNASYELEATTTSTVYELMKKSQINFKTKTFSGLGEFVEEINGLKNDNKSGKYWIYYINGESAKLGISQQIAKPNDIITWKYENTNF